MNKGEIFEMEMQGDINAWIVQGGSLRNGAKNCFICTATLKSPLFHEVSSIRLCRVARYCGSDLCENILFALFEMRLKRALTQAKEENLQDDNLTEMSRKYRSSGLRIWKGAKARFFLSKISV